MAKANRKSKKEELTESIVKSFSDWKKLMEQLVETANKAQMPLLAKSLDLDLEILKVYEKAFLHVAD